MDIGVTLDERIADGFYFALARIYKLLDLWYNNFGVLWGKTMICEV